MKSSNQKPGEKDAYKRPPLSVQLRGYLKLLMTGRNDEKNGLEPFVIHTIKTKIEADNASNIYRNCHLELADIRILPYPFRYFMTLNSDCDSINMDGLLNTSKIIREQYGLPIADSIFPKWLYLRGLQVSLKSAGDNHEAGKLNCFEHFAEQNFDWLRTFSKGATDTVHGWIPRMRIKIAKDFSLGWQPPFGQWMENKLAEPGQGLFATGLHRLLQWPSSRWNRRKKLKFIVPPSWHRREPPRYLYFEASLPFAGRWFEIHIRTAAGVSATASSASICAGRLGLNAYLVDLVNLLKVDPRDLNDIEVEFELKGGRIGKLKVLNPTLLSDTRADIEKQMQCMQEFNIAVTAYTSHGGGYDIGRQTSPSISACDPRIVAEYRDNPHYALDLFKAYGIEFFNTASNTSANRIQNISDLVYPNVLNDGTAIYDYTRFLSYSPDDLAMPEKAGDPVTDPSYSEAAGRQVFAALGRLKDTGDGALIYTHLLVKAVNNKDRGDHSVQNLLNSDTHAALRELSDRYYGLTQQNDSSQRLWIAPASILLRYSSVYQGIHSHAFYDQARNIIHIDPWQDYVLDRIIPDQRYGIRELRGLTFYVSDAHTARLLVDGTEYDCLIRNSVDETGKESITIADVECPTVLSGKIPWKGCNQIQSVYDGVAHDCSSSENTLILESGHGVAKISNPGCTLAHNTFIACRFRKSVPDLRFRIDIKCNDDLVLSFAEEGYSDLAEAYIVKPWNSLEERSVILPYHYVLSVLPPHKRRIPRGIINTIKIHIDGSPGDRLTIKELHLLRDSDLPRDDSCLLGGEIQTRKDIVKVTASGNNQTISVKPFENGQFLFHKKLARGHIYEITGLTHTGESVVPCEGKIIELTGNYFEIRF